MSIKDVLKCNPELFDIRLKVVGTDGQHLFYAGEWWLRKRATSPKAHLFAEIASFFLSSSFYQGLRFDWKTMRAFPKEK